MDTKASIQPESSAPLRFLGGMQGTVPHRILLSCPWNGAFVLYYTCGPALLDEGRSAWQFSDEGVIRVCAGQTPVLTAPERPLRILSIMFGKMDEPFDAETGTAVRTPKQKSDTTLKGLFTSLLEQLPSKREGPLLDEFFTKLTAETQPLPPNGTQPPDSICLLKKIFDTRYAEKLTLNLLAGELHWNKYKLEKDFKKYFGCSPFEYLLKVRIKAACHLLRETSCSILNIGFAVEIENASYFTRIFKRLTGMSPLDYRKHYSASILQPSNHYSV